MSIIDINYEGLISLNIIDFGVSKNHIVVQ